MSSLTITLIQTNLFWENKKANLDRLQQKIESIEPKTEIVILPEMFTTGFSMQPELFAEKILNHLEKLNIKITNINFDFDILFKNMIFDKKNKLNKIILIIPVNFGKTLSYETNIEELRNMIYIFSKIK